MTVDLIMGGLDVRHLVYTLAIQKQDEYGDLHVKIINKGTVLKQVSTYAPYRVVSLTG